VKFGIIPAHGPDHLDAAIEHVRLARRYGFDSVWIEEHHAPGPYWPTPLLAAAALTPYLERMSIGTDVLVLPLHDPVHIAEQAAVLDRMTGGRFVLGVGLGDSVSEFATFNVPAQQRGARFEEQIAIIRALWTGDSVTYKGDFYELDGAQLAAPPLSPTGPPIWIGGWGPRQIERAARIGDAWLPGPVGRMDEVAQRQATYDTTLQALAQDPAARARPITRDVIVATTDSEAWQLALGLVLRQYVETYADEHTLLSGGASKPASTDELRKVAHDRLLIGSPGTVAAEAARIIRQLGADDLIFRLKLPGLSPDQITIMLALLGEVVLPELRTSIEA
jgi:alkanesulfonate monooxygenase SsuD/methylene tetrahydromethanopterin reductase-like flavin-dependent oxidoreductase (luciferase family)